MGSVGNDIGILRNSCWSINLECILIQGHGTKEGDDELEGGTGTADLLDHLGSIRFGWVLFS